MSVQNGEKLLTKQDLTDFYNRILPYLGGMPEVLANKFSKGDMYSTDEKMIGQWIDGKPLYQKTIEVGTLMQASQESYISLNTPNVDKLIKYDGVYFEYSDNNEFESIFHLANSRGYMCPYKNYATNSLLMAYKLTFALSNVFVTVQYTKTTDAAISIGDDTDYSTDEKIVGTWVNDKPVYQKTFILNNPRYDWQAIDIGLGNVDALWKTDCYAETSDGTILIEHSYGTTSYFTVMPYVASSTHNASIYIQTKPTYPAKVYITLQYTKTTD